MARNGHPGNFLAGRAVRLNMAVSLDTGGGAGGRKSVDIDLNLVPFIDMMSVLVAFLLITAVWTHLGRLDVEVGAGKGAEDSRAVPAETLSVLVAEDAYWLSMPGHPSVRVLRADAGEVKALDQAIAELGASRLVAPSTRVEVAAEDRVPYQDVVTAMDRLVAHDLKGISFTDPPSLTTRPKL